MTEQSEHLSNAQIENYGIRTSGAGPEAAQRDEHQRVADQHLAAQHIDEQSIKDQRVEAHLADCASCRDRLLGFHRSLFTRAVDLPEADPPKNDASFSGYSPSDQRSADSKVEGERPTDSALADSKFANPKYPADPQVRTAPTPECPSTETLRELAAGLTPDDLAPALTRHAATCDHCGPLLRTFTEDFSDDFSPEEQAVLNNLQSGTAAWQRKTAREMLQAAGTSAAGNTSAAGASASEAGSSVAATAESDKKSFSGKRASATTERKPFFFWKWALVPATTAVVAVAAFSVWHTHRDTPEKVEKLLAQASTEPRTMEVRWPKASWSQYSVQRGTMVEAKSTSLMQAEIAVGRQPEKTLQEIAWVRVVAEKEIIAGHPQNAIPALEQALRSHPGQVPLLLDLAIAYFGQAEQIHSRESYEKSLDLLGSVLQREPTNTVALFNRALVYERLNAKDKAADDWNTFLKTEKDVHWLAEAQKKLTDLRDLK